ncbi:MAG TPA: host attachment protein [Dissulfurispiraceae bacterium]|nr:host attachment protein [Dissulfurispiraceae bacterium]
MSKIVIVAARGRFEAYRFTRTDKATPRLELIGVFDLISAHKKLSEKVSDSAGRFGRKGAPSHTAKGYGEEHTVRLEEERRLIKSLADAAADVLKQEKAGSWILAAEKSIASQLQEALDPSVRGMLAGTIPANLSKADKSEILKRVKDI